MDVRGIGGAAVAAVGAALVGVLAVAEVRAADSAGRIVAVRQDVAVLRGGAGRVSAAAEAAVAMGDIVETGPGARAKVLMLDETVLSMGENGRLALEHYAFSPESQRAKAAWRLGQGTVRVAVGRSDLEIRTAAAVVSAQGTSFFVWMEGTPAVRTCVLVTGGKVAVRRSDLTAAGELVAGEGMLACIGPGEEPRAAAADVALSKRLAGETTALVGADWERVRVLPPAFAPEPSKETAEGPGTEKGSGESVKGLVKPPVPLQPVVIVTPPPPPPPPAPTVPPVVPPGPRPPPEEQQRSVAR